MLGFLPSSGSGAEARTHVFLLAGQSNMVGLASVMESGDTLPPPGVFLWTTFGPCAGRWQPLALGSGPDSALFGPEWTLGKSLAESFPGDSVHFIKIAAGNTSLALDWRPPSLGNQGWVYGLIEPSLLAAYGQWSSGELPPLEGVFWMQGETDAIKASDAEAYEDNLAHLIADVRAARKQDSLPWVVGLIDRQPIWSLADQVRAAQWRVSRSVPGIGLVETRGLGTDGVHYTASGQMELGRRMARRWLVMQGRMADTLEPIDTTFGQGAAPGGGLNPRGLKAFLLGLPPGTTVRVGDGRGSLSTWRGGDRVVEAGAPVGDRLRPVVVMATLPDGDLRVFRTLRGPLR